MVIYGTALLAFCFLAGLWIGDMLGFAIGVEKNMGGVGIAMLLLVLSTERLRKRGWLEPLSEQGLAFWSAIYIPVVVAMASQQDVIGALRGGPAALLAGTLAVVLGFVLVPLISRINSPQAPAAGGERMVEDLPAPARVVEDE